MLFVFWVLVKWIEVCWRLIHFIVCRSCMKFHTCFIDVNFVLRTNLPLWYFFAYFLLISFLFLCRKANIILIAKSYWTKAPKMNFDLFLFAFLFIFKIRTDSLQYGCKPHISSCDLLCVRFFAFLVSINFFVTCLVLANLPWYATNIP